MASKCGARPLLSLAQMPVTVTVEHLPEPPVPAGLEAYHHLVGTAEDPFHLDLQQLLEFLAGRVDASAGWSVADSGARRSAVPAR